MQILGQSGDKMVNLEKIIALTICNIGDWQKGKEVENKYRILAWSGNEEQDCFGIGDYATEDRAKEIIKEIWQKYGQYLHRPGGPAMLRGSVDVPEAFWVLPKIYEMPQE